MIKVKYPVGEPSCLDCAYQVAKDLAADAGLEFSPTSDGVIRWIKGPG
jgi:hypothetical protein